MRKPGTLDTGVEANSKIPGSLLYLKGWLGAMARQDDPVTIPTHRRNNTATLTW